MRTEKQKKGLCLLCGGGGEPKSLQPLRYSRYRAVRYQRHIPTSYHPPASVFSYRLPTPQSAIYHFVRARRRRRADRVGLLPSIQEQFDFLPNSKAVEHCTFKRALRGSAVGAVLRPAAVAMQDTMLPLVAWSCTVDQCDLSCRSCLQRCRSWSIRAP